MLQHFFAIQQPQTTRRLAFAAIAMLSIGILITSTARARAQANTHYTMSEVIDAGHGFFGATSGALATLVERAFTKYGLPNGYILGEEAGGAFIGGLRYGEGVLYTKNAGDYKLYWQGPSVGWDYGIEGNRTMTLVYKLPAIDSIYQRFFGISGSAYAIGGVGMTVLGRNGIVLVPIRTGVGARLGINIGYLKIRRTPRIFPF